MAREFMDAVCDLRRNLDEMDDSDDDTDDDDTDEDETNNSD